MKLRSVAQGSGAADIKVSGGQKQEGRPSTWG